MMPVYAGRCEDCTGPAGIASCFVELLRASGVATAPVPPPQPAPTP